MTEIKREEWVDGLRGFCMLAILWFHTEMYYIGTDATPYAFYVGDVLAAFFVVSGYLFCRGEAFSLRRKVQRIVRGLVVPYFVFTLLMAVPKALAHGNSLSITSLLLPIVSGHASWFVAALIVSELLFAVGLHFLHQRPWLLAASALLMLVASAVIGNGYTSPNPSEGGGCLTVGGLLSTSFYFEADYWRVNEALLGYFLLAVGYFLRRNTKENDRMGWGKSLVLLVFLVFIVLLKFLILRGDHQLLFCPLRVSSWLLFLPDLLVATAFLIILFRLLPAFRPLSWVGKHSLYYYFFCGGAPLLVSRALTAIGMPYSGFFTQIVAFVLVVALASLLVGIVVALLRSEKI